MARHKMTMNGDGTMNVLRFSEDKTPASNELQYREQIGRRIEMLRVHAGLTKAELGRAAGVTISCVYNWENGRTKPDIAILPSLCRALNISISEFFSDDCAAADLNENEKRLISNVRRLNEPNRILACETIDRMLELQEQYDTTVRLRADIIPVSLADDCLAAGIGTSDDSGTCSRRLYLHASDIARRADFAFVVNGDSMEPTFHNGATVLVQRINDRYDCHQGDIIAFTADNVAYIKEYRREGFFSHNPKYKPMYFRNYETIYCIGRVIGTIAEEDYATEEEKELYLANHKEG